MNNKMFGYIKSYDSKANTGYIKGKDKNDYFYTITDVDKPKELAVGIKVAFIPKLTDIIVSAESIEKIDDFKLSKNYDDIAKNFYNSKDTADNYTNSVDNVGLWESEKIIFSKYLKKEDKILDLGCGAGRTTINLYKEGFTNITGLDISEELIKYARYYSLNNGLDVLFTLGDATKLDSENNTFDSLIYSYNGITCIPGVNNREKALKEAYRVLKPGGIFIFTAHDRDDSGSKNIYWEEEKIAWDKGLQDKNLEIYGDFYDYKENGSGSFIHFYSIPEMKEFIETTNFKILEISKSTDIAEETENVKNFAGKTVFWILQKEE